MLCVRQIVWVWWSECVLCVGQFGLGLRECVCMLCVGQFVWVLGVSVCCVEGEFDGGLRKCVCAVCGRVVRGLG